MLKKRRFRKKTLGRLQMFFEKKPYTGFKYFALFTIQSQCAVLKNSYNPTGTHYKHVTKKKLYYINHKFCKYYKFNRQPYPLC